MLYKKLENIIVIRILSGEDVIESIKNVVNIEHIASGTISGIGSVKQVDLELFNSLDKINSRKEFRGDFEIVSLCGNISSLNDQPFIHLHMSISDNKFYTYGGHLTKAVVSSTAEIIINVINGQLNRRYDEETKLDLLNFD